MMIHDDNDICLGEKKVFRLKHASTKFNIFNILLDILTFFGEKKRLLKRNRS